MNTPASHSVQEEGEWIIKVDMSEPATGFFSVRLGKGHLHRPLMVFHDEGENSYVVYLDGVKIAPHNKDWRIAFGKLYAGGNDLIGKRISREQYAALVKQRRLDIEKGIDLDAPFDHSQFPVP